jgi:hypothetical protein
MLTDTQAAWFAGFVDGEGTIGLQRIKRVLSDGRQVFQYMPKMSVANTHLPTIRLIAKITNGARSQWPLQNRKNSILKDGSVIGNYKQCYCVQWSAERARILLREILPFLVTKKKQAELVLSCPKGRRGGLNGHKRNTQLSERTRKQQQNIYWKIRKLNSGKERHPGED